MITINANRAATARTRRRRDGRPRSPAGGGARHNHPRQRQQHPAGEVGERETGISQSQFARRRRRNDGRGGGRGGGLMRALPFLGGVIMIGSMTRGTEAQFVDGGAVAMSCDECACEGSSDDGTIAVLDNPSSGARIALADGEYSEILETSCGKSVIAVGTTLYELSGIDLETRTLEVVDMSAADCTTPSTPSTADCYSGSTPTVFLDNDVEMDITFALGTWTDGSTFYKSNVQVTVVGASDVDPVIEEFCLDYGFVSQLFKATVGSEEYLYNFEFAVPGEDTSSDLSVASAPSTTSAEAVACGADVSPTPAPVKPAAPPTPSPVEPLPPPTPSPTPKPTSKATDTPVAAPTPSPPPPPTPAPVAAAAPATPSPTPPPSTLLPPPPTPAPVDVAASVMPQSAAETPTDTPGGVATPSPVAVAAPTAGPGAGGGEVPTAAPSVGATSVPAVGGNGTSSSGGGGGGGDDDGGGEGVASDTPTMAPTPVATLKETLAPMDTTETEGLECLLPEDEESCTQSTSVADINSGVGSYYDLACNSTLAASGKVSGCDPDTSKFCRACFFNTPLYTSINPGEDLPDLVDCPCCVLEVYGRDTASNEDGPRCESVSPAPTVASADPRGFETLSFDDEGARMSGGEGVALAALALFAALTFFPFCSK